MSTSARSHKFGAPAAGYGSSEERRKWICLPLPQVPLTGRNIHCFAQASMTENCTWKKIFGLFMLSIRLSRKPLWRPAGPVRPLPRRAPWGIHWVLMTAGRVLRYHGVPARMFIGTTASHTNPPITDG